MAECSPYDVRLWDKYPELLSTLCRMWKNNEDRSQRLHLNDPNFIFDPTQHCLFDERCPQIIEDDTYLKDPQGFILFPSLDIGALRLFKSNEKLNVDSIFSFFTKLDAYIKNASAPFSFESYQQRLYTACLIWRQRVAITADELVYINKNDQGELEFIRAPLAPFTQQPFGTCLFFDSESLTQARLWGSGGILLACPKKTKTIRWVEGQDVKKVVVPAIKMVSMPLFTVMAKEMPRLCGSVFPRIVFRITIDPKPRWLRYPEETRRYLESVEGGCDAMLPFANPRGAEEVALVKLLHPASDELNVYEGVYMNRDFLYKWFNLQEFPLIDTRNPLSDDRLRYDQRLRRVPPAYSLSDRDEVYLMVALRLIEFLTVEFTELGTADLTCFVFMIGTLAHTMQRPWESPQLFSILKSDQGIGKSTLVELLLTIFGPKTAIPVSNVEQLVGRFAQVSGYTFIAMDDLPEQFGNVLQERIKSLLTAHTMTTERKFAQPTTAVNLQPWLFGLTNKDVKLDMMTGRRTLILEPIHPSEREVFTQFRSRMSAALRCDFFEFFNTNRERIAAVLARFAYSLPLYGPNAIHCDDYYRYCIKVNPVSHYQKAMKEVAAIEELGPQCKWLISRMMAGYVSSPEEKWMDGCVFVSAQLLHAKLPGRPDDKASFLTVLNALLKPEAKIKERPIHPLESSMPRYRYLGAASSTPYVCFPQISVILRNFVVDFPCSDFIAKLRRRRDMTDYYEAISDLDLLSVQAIHPSVKLGPATMASAFPGCDAICDGPWVERFMRFSPELVEYSCPLSYLPPRNVEDAGNQAIKRAREVAVPIILPQEVGLENPGGLVGRVIRLGPVEPSFVSRHARELERQQSDQDIQSLLAAHGLH